jgi:hypothetical protein
MYSKKNRGSLLRSTLSILTFVLTIAVILSGCAVKGSNINTVTPSKQDGGNLQKVSTSKVETENKIMSEFRLLIGTNPKLKSVIEFIDKNIPNVTKENGFAMVEDLEQIQEKYLTSLEEKFFSSGDIQDKISKLYKSGLDLSKINDIKDEELKTLLLETRDSGYRIETAEGMYFPMMNYEYYKKYNTYVTADMKEYIDIMAVETNKVPAKDAALIIGWDDIIKRALSQEAFIKNYGNSTKAESVKKLQKRYITFILYGLNNTPLFDYETKELVPAAKTVYLNAIKNVGDSAIIKMLNNYMDILGKTNYKLSDSADKFRKEAVQ